MSGRWSPVLGRVYVDVEPRPDIKSHPEVVQSTAARDDRESPEGGAR